MAVHKVPQDVEADDKFLGPLSFKQFLFMGGTVICGYLTFLTFTKVWPISFIFLFPTIVLGFLAFPWSKEQPTELWLASRIRFLIMPRKRIWDQTGIKELVTVTVPIREAHIYTDGLSQDQVKDRLGALASIVDSRGWAVKNVLQSETEESDRLVAVPVAMPDTINDTIVESTPDVFDNSEGTIAKQFDTMIENSEKQHRSETLKLVEKAREQVKAPDPTENTSKSKTHKKLDPSKEQDFWFLHNQPAPPDPSLAVFQSSTVVAPGADASTIAQPVAQASTSSQMSEEDLLKTAHKKHERDAMQTIPRHERVIDPNGSTTKANQNSEEKDVSTMTATSNPDILNLAKSNDLNVETLSRQANKKELDDGEVVISLR